MFAMFFHHLDESCEERFCACLWAIGLLETVDEIAHVVEHGQKEGAYQVSPEEISLIAESFLNDVEILLKGFNLFILKTDDWMAAGKDEKGVHISYSLDDFVEEVDADHHDKSFEIGR